MPVDLPVPGGVAQEAAPILARLDTPSLNRIMATFAAALQGRASVDQAARSAGVDPATLMPAVVALSGSAAAAR